MVDWPGSEHLTGVESDRRTHRCLMGIDRPDTILPAPKRPWKIFKAYLLILDRIEFQPQSPSSLSFQDTALHLSSDLVDCPTRWSLWYWYLDFYVDHLYISIHRWLEKYSTAMCYTNPYYVRLQSSRAWVEILRCVQMQIKLWPYEHRWISNSCILICSRVTGKLLQCVAN